jgi:copper transport protein
VVRALLIALVALAIAAPAASAHATLEGTSPARGAAVKAAKQVVFRFNEPVEGSFGAVRVFDARGTRVDDGHVAHPNGAGEKIAVGLRSGLGKGAYTATYRVVSADGHPVSGGVVFDIGAPGAVPAQSVDDLLKGAKTGPQTAVAMGVAKAAGYFAIAVALGGMIFLLAVWGPALRASQLGAAAAPFAGRARRLLVVAAGVGAASTAAGIVLEGATAAGTSFWSALDERIVREVLSTDFGTMWALRLGAWLLLGAGLAATALRRAPATVAVPAPVALRPAVAMAGGGSFSDRAGVRGSAQAGGPPLPGASPARNLPGGPAAAIGLGIVGCALALTPALAGHAHTQSPVALLVSADVVHVVGMSAWLGGLVFLLFAVPAATRALEPADRTRLLAATLQRFSPLALASVLALAVTGTIQALVEVRTLDALTGTAFGRAVAIKAILLCVLIGLGAINRQRVVPTLRRLAAGGAAPGDAGRLLRRTLRAEVALVVAVLAVTGALTGYAPPTAATATTAGPVSVTQRVGPLDVQMTIDPARVGPNAVHMYLFKAADGAPFTGTKELKVKASLPSRGIGPLDLTLHRAGPGHYVADAVTLSPGGDWKLAVTDRVSDFDEYTTTVKATVR